MKQEFGIWLPDSETHLQEFLKDGGTYQRHTFDAAMRYVSKFNHALDIGAHVGLWSLPMRDRFVQVSAFEPVAEFRECFRANLSQYEPLVVLHSCALGDHAGNVAIQIEKDNTGHSGVDQEMDVVGGPVVPLRTLDSFALHGIDFIKIDTEGYELPIVRGGMRTLLANKPIVVIEQKRHPYEYERFAAVKFLEQLGMRTLERVVDDFIMGWA